MVRKFYIAISTVFICSFIFCLLAGVIIYKDTIAWAESIKTYEVNGVCSNQRILRAMRFHGIRFTEYRQNKREWGYYRDNKWCSLYRSIPKKAWDRYYAGLQSKEKRG